MIEAHMGDSATATSKLGERIGEHWPNIQRARDLSYQRLAELSQGFADADSDDTSIVVYGSLNSTCRDSEAKVFQRAGAHVVKADGASHFLPMEYPDLVRHEIERMAGQTV